MRCCADPAAASSSRSASRGGTRGVSAEGPAAPRGDRPLPRGPRCRERKRSRGRRRDRRRPARAAESRRGTRDECRAVADLRASPRGAGGRQASGAGRASHGDFAAERTASPRRPRRANRVVCCYPDYDALVGAAAERTERTLVLTFPRDAWWTRLRSAHCARAETPPAVVPPVRAPAGRDRRGGARSRSRVSCATRWASSGSSSQWIEPRREASRLPARGARDRAVRSRGRSARGGRDDTGRGDAAGRPRRRLGA